MGVDEMGVDEMGSRRSGNKPLEAYLQCLEWKEMSVAVPYSCR